jgi:hypothetical protein
MDELERDASIEVGMKKGAKESLEANFEIRVVKLRWFVRSS